MIGDRTAETCEELNSGPVRRKDNAAACPIYRAHVARVLNSVHVIGIAPREIGAWLAANWVGIVTGRYNCTVPVPLTERYIQA